MPAKKAAKRRPRIKCPPPMLPESTWEPAAMTIILRVPAPELRPNGRPPHWRVKHKATKDARAQAKLTTLILLRGHEPPAPVAYSFRYFWAGPQWDDDNAIASPKAYLDGISDALRINDKTLRFRELIRDTDKQKPRLEIILHFDP